ncbi:hypothetical protein CsSME_00035160 [Camellia sinensis var. sinensis]
MHLSITRTEALEKAVLESAMSSERLTVSLEAENEGHRAAEREVFCLNLVVAFVEKFKEIVVNSQAKLEGKVSELEVVIIVMATECSTLEAKYWQQGWDDARDAYKEEVLVKNNPVLYYVN